MLVHWKTNQCILKVSKIFKNIMLHESNFIGTGDDTLLPVTEDVLAHKVQYVPAWNVENIIKTCDLLWHSFKFIHCDILYSGNINILLMFPCPWLVEFRWKIFFRWHWIGCSLDLSWWIWVFWSVSRIAQNSEYSSIIITPLNNFKISISSSDTTQYEFYCIWHRHC